MSETHPKPTIYDIAKLSGASPSIVSATLNGTWKRRRVAKATALRIVADHRKLLLGLATGTIACLSLSVTEGVLTFRLATSWHVWFSVT